LQIQEDIIFSWMKICNPCVFRREIRSKSFWHFQPRLCSHRR